MESFGLENGFFLAVGVTNYDGKSDPIEDLSIGQLRFFIKSWG